MCGAHKSGTLATYLEITGEYFEMLGLISWKSSMHADSFALNSTEFRKFANLRWTFSPRVSLSLCMSWLGANFLSMLGLMTGGWQCLLLERDGIIIIMLLNTLHVMGLSGGSWTQHGG